MPNNLLEYYKICFSNLNRNKLHGEVAPHKIIFLLAIIDQVEEILMHGESGRQVILTQPFEIGPHLEYFFEKEWHLHVASEVFKPSFENPLIHMQYEPFYHLVPKDGITYSGAHSKAAIMAAFAGIKLDDELIQLLLDKQSRIKMRNFLIGLI